MPKNVAGLSKPLTRRGRTSGLRSISTRKKEFRMKRQFAAYVLCLLALAGTGHLAQSQARWIVGPASSFASGDSVALARNNGWAVVRRSWVSPGGRVHVAYSKRTGNPIKWKVFTKHTSNYGRSWAAPMQVSGHRYDARDAVIAFLRDTIALVSGDATHLGNHVVNSTRLRLLPCGHVRAGLRVIADATHL